MSMKYQKDDIEIFEESLTRLKAQYDLFFLGGRKLPPMEDRRRLDAHVHEMAKMKHRDNAKRFRFNSLLGKYNQYKELWTRKMREREEGPTDYRRRAAAMAAPAAPPPPAPEPQVTSAPRESYVKVSGQDGDAESMRELYQRVVDANTALGQPTSMSLEQLTAVVSQQTRTIRERYQAPAIAFRIDTSEGKVKLRAKPVNE